MYAVYLLSLEQTIVSIVLQLWSVVTTPDIKPLGPGPPAYVITSGTGYHRVKGLTKPTAILDTPNTAGD